MKRSTKNQIEELVKAINKKNDSQEQYEVKVEKYGRVKYSMDIFYKKIMFSTDFEEIIKLCFAENLMVRPSVMNLKNGEHLNYLAIQ